MTGSAASATRRLVVFAASFAALFLQVSLMRLMVVRFHPALVFATIGVALLGYGAAGSLLAAFGHPRPAAVPAFVGRTLLAASTLTVPIFLILHALDVSSRVLFETPAGWGLVVLYYAAASIPFLLIGLAVSVLFSAFPDDVYRLYLFDLLGAGAGGLCAVLAIPGVGGPALLPLAALVASLGAVVAFGPAGRPRAAALLLAASNLAAVVLLAFRSDLDVRVPDDKHGPIIARAAKPDGLRVEVSRWTRFGRVDITEPFDTLPPQFGGDFSPWFLRPIEQRMLTLDGAAPAFLYRVADRPEDMPFLAGSSQSVGYAIRPRARVLVIGVGGGTDVLIALHHQAQSVTAVELNPVNAEAVAHRYAEYLGNALRDPRVHLVVAEGRNFAARDRHHYDLIQLSGVDTGAAHGTYGLGTLPESHIYTVEAIEDFLDRLSPDGVLSITRDRAFGWAARVVALAREALRRAGADPAAHIAVVEGKGYGWATVLVKRTPFTSGEIEAVETFSRTYDFPLVYRPDRLENGVYDRVIRSAIEADNGFDLRPATDDWPFLFYSVPLGSALRADRSGASPLARPLRLLVVNLVALAVVAVLLIGLPLLRVGHAWRGAGGRLALVGYFVLLGAGFILVEVALMQRFTVFLGDPALAVATVLAALLVGSGLGSAFAPRAGDHATRAIGIAIAAIVLTQLVLAMPLVPAMLRDLLGLPLPIRFAIAVGLVGLVGFPMGMPFPTGLQRVAARHAALVPWAWGINGMVSVVSSLAAYLLGLTLGYAAMFHTAAVLYLGALGLFRRL